MVIVFAGRRNADSDQIVTDNKSILSGKNFTQRILNRLCKKGAVTCEFNTQLRVLHYQCLIMNIKPSILNKNYNFLCIGTVLLDIIIFIICLYYYIIFSMLENDDCKTHCLHLLLNNLNMLQF